MRVRSSQKVFFVFIFVAVLFIVGHLFELDNLTFIANLLLIPTLILYYRFRTKRWFKLMVLVLVLFYIRDVFIFYGFVEYPYVVLISFLVALMIIYLFTITAFQKARVHIVEWISLLIMYGFLGFLFYTVSELIPQVMSSFVETTYLYLFLLTFLLAITFTQYLIKSHYASLWLMLASASLLISELSLFFKMYIIADISVNVFFPLFHVITYYALVEHALHRRRSKSIPFL